jgi:Zn-finger nucleic acid-binding protein
VRTLAGCPICKRQFDTSGMTVGSRFRCRCGQVIEVPRVSARDAAVVRCSSCGGTREDGAAACVFCGSDFTIHEQDLQTICPACFARIGARARFCHHCATPIVPEDVAGAETDNPCPACGREHRLRSRALGESGLSALECIRCAGLWLAAEAFRVLSDQARKTTDPAPDPAVVAREVRTRLAPVSSAGPAYRPCPVCSTRMNRTNFGRCSGVVIDRCRDHGYWFDAADLDTVLRWIRDGGGILAEERRREEEREATSALRFRVEPKSPEDAFRPDQEPAWADGGVLPALLRIFCVKLGGHRI